MCRQSLNDSGRFSTLPHSPKQHIWKAVVPPTHSSSPWISHIYNFNINIIETQRSGGLQRDLSLILSPQQRKSELADVPFDPVCSFTMLGIYRAAKPPTCSPYPTAITWLSSSGLTGGTARLSTHCSLTEPRTFLFLWFQSSWPLLPHYSRTARSVGANWAAPNWICREVKRLAQGQLDSSCWRRENNITHSALTTS